MYDWLITALHRRKYYVLVNFLEYLGKVCLYSHDLPLKIQCIVCMNTFYQKRCIQILSALQWSTVTSCGWYSKVTSANSLVTVVPTTRLFRSKRKHLNNHQINCSEVLKMPIYDFLWIFIFYHFEWFLQQTVGDQNSSFIHS